MKSNSFVDPVSGVSVYPLPGGVTLAYNLCLGCTISRWKGIIEEIHYGGSIIPLAITENLDLEKPSFGPSKWPWKLKLAKLVNC